MGQSNIDFYRLQDQYACHVRVKIEGAGNQIWNNMENMDFAENHLLGNLLIYTLGPSTNEDQVRFSMVFDLATCGDLLFKAR